VHPHLKKEEVGENRTGLLPREERGQMATNSEERGEKTRDGRQKPDKPGGVIAFTASRPVRVRINASQRKEKGRGRGMRW